MTIDILGTTEKNQNELTGNLCRGCGRCMPCPVGIEINTCARMSLLLRQSSAELQLTKEVQDKMRRIKKCFNCGRCSSSCPYGLNVPKLLKENYKDYMEVLAGKVI
ncbi:4Fe-4S dicluster domain-containing protein [Anaerosporobacter sp.]